MAEINNPAANAASTLIVVMDCPLRKLVNDDDSNQLSPGKNIVDMQQHNIYESLSADPVE